MKQIGKTIYILNDDVHISVDNGAILITQNNIEKTKIPVGLVENIVVFGYTTISSSLVQFCSANNIDISYVSPYGKFYGRFVGEHNRCIVLRKKQYDLYNSSKALEFTKTLMLAKFLNSKNTLLQSAKDSPDEDAKIQLTEAAKKISETKQYLLDAQSFDEILGIEGLNAQMYFSVFDYMLRPKDASMVFEQRTKRPPANFCNSLISFFYVLFTNDITAALESVGLDSYMGYNHKLHPGRQSLSLDVLEEFRSCVVDRFVISIINKNQVTHKDFENAERGIVLTETGRRKCLNLWEEYKNTVVKHEYINKKCEIRLLPFLQAQILSQFVRGDIDMYVPFVR